MLLILQKIKKILNINAKPESNGFDRVLDLLDSLDEENKYDDAIDQINVHISKYENALINNDKLINKLNNIISEKGDNEEISEKISKIRDFSDDLISRIEKLNGKKQGIESKIQEQEEQNVPESDMIEELEIIASEEKIKESETVQENEQEENIVQEPEIEQIEKTGFFSRLFSRKDNADEEGKQESDEIIEEKESEEPIFQAQEIIEEPKEQVIIKEPEIIATQEKIQEQIIVQEQENQEPTMSESQDNNEKKKNKKRKKKGKVIESQGEIFTETVIENVSKQGFFSYIAGFFRGDKPEIVTTDKDNETSESVPATEKVESEEPKKEIDKIKEENTPENKDKEINSAEDKKEKKNFFFNRFFKKEKSDSLNELDKALNIIKNYEKENDLKSAEFALRELILKHRSAIGYNEELIRKYYVLEISNIEEVSINAKDKIKKINGFSSELNKRLALLEDKLAKNLLKKEQQTQKEKDDQDLKFFKEIERDFKDLMKQEKYDDIGNLTEKLIKDFPDNKMLLDFLSKIQKNIDNIKKNNTFFKRIAGIFISEKKDRSEFIKGFKEAILLVDAYEKENDFKSAINAINELILKHKFILNNNDEQIKKLYVLRSSNIKEVSDNAKEKIKKIIEISNELSKRLSLLESKLQKNKMNLQEQEDKNLRKQDLLKFKEKDKEIKILIKQKEYTKALALAKKLASDFSNNKESLSILTKIQKIYNNKQIDKEKEIKKNEKINDILNEIGVDLNKNKNLPIPIHKKFLRFFLNFVLMMRSRNDDNKRQKSLNKIERLLSKHGTINDIDLKVIDDDFFDHISKGLVKDLEGFTLKGFNVFGRIIGKDRIVGDTFGYKHIENDKTLFYFGDATGHGIQAGFTVALLTKIFFECTKKIRDFQELFLKVNNDLKEKIKGKVFITSIFFEWNNIKSKLNIIGAGHIPLLIYRKKESRIERVIAGGLALGVRMINNSSSIKIKELDLEDGDIIFAYTDGIIEIKNDIGEMYHINKLEACFLKACKLYTNQEKIFEYLMKEFNDFKGANSFEDDVTIILFGRDFNKDMVSGKEELDKILQEINVKNFKIPLKNATKEEIINLAKKEKYSRELKIRLERLERLYKIGEFGKLKQETLIYFKEGYAHDKMKFYLEKSIMNEQKMQLKKQDEKLQKKYSLLNELYKKGEYEIVIKEAIDVIFKNGNI
ncbi:MAG: SpoIIE family protein phosphatase [Candidatus Gracilibacteria bacterium]|nr:SpoIIE family protein phosphatase [Candidatus Gracilibacteria bacterium]